MRVLIVFILLFSSLGLQAQDDDMDPAKERQKYQESINNIQKDMQEEMGRPEGESFEDTVDTMTGGGDDYVGLPSGDSADDGSALSDLKKKYIPAVTTNPLASKPKEEVEEILLQRVRGSTWEKLLTKNPRFLAFMVDFLSHKDAFLRFASVVSKPAKLKKYFYCFLVVFIISMYWNYKLPKNVSFWSKVQRKLMFYFGALSINMGSFYMIFRDELGVSVSIFWKHFGFF